VKFIYRVYKKSSPNNKITIYLNTRDLSVSEQEQDKLQGVLVVDPEYLAGRKVNGPKTYNIMHVVQWPYFMPLSHCGKWQQCLPFGIPHSTWVR